MRAVMEKLWFRLLMLAVFFVSLLAAVLAASMFRYLLIDGWYSNDFQFENTSMCNQYVVQSLWNVESNLQWLEDPYSTELGGYGGKAFSYLITDGGTGDIKADTRTERSHYVYSLPGVVTLSDGRTYSLSGYVNLPVEPYEGCYLEYYLFENVYPLRNIILPIAIAGALLTMLSLAVSLSAVTLEGKQGRLTLLGRIPADVLAVGLAIAANLFFYVFVSWQVIANLLDVLSLLGVYRGRFETVVTLYILMLTGCCVANQLGAGVCKERLLLRRIILRVSPLAIAVGVLAVNIVGALAVLFLRSAIAMPLALFDLALIPCAVKWGMEARSIRKASSALAAGDLHYKVDTGRLHMVWKDLGEDLNSIGDGMALAVDEQMRAERMKTELITNVSHDLKTPLTSIVNYIQLLMGEDLPEDVRREYLEVLDRQSAKLKKLTVDVIEASRAASGAVNVSSEVFDVRELLQQSAGEYAERMTTAGIEPVLHIPEEELWVLADPRLVGRVMDNLLTNVLKYAQPGTRAYFDLSSDGEEVVVAIKNTSREPLDIPADELMERFVRGDSSRSTEGSGLGLSIARSLSELMGGHLQLTLDGDLFKAEVLFPAAAAPAQPEEQPISPDPE